MFKVSRLLELLRKIANLLRDKAEMLGSKDSVDDQFIEMIDDLVVMSEKDSELAEGLRWIDVQSQKERLVILRDGHDNTEKALGREASERLAYGQA